LVLVFWIAALVLLVLSAWRVRRPVVGLTIAYWFQLWLLHWVGGMISVLSFYEGPDRGATLAGFGVTGYAIAGLLLGNLVFALLSGPEAPPAKLPRTDMGRPALTCVAIGLALYFVAGRALPRIPGTDAVIGSGFGLALAGFCLLWFFHWSGGRRVAAWRALACAATAPFLTIILAGFLGYGVSFLMTMGSFVAVFYRPRWRIALLGSLAILLGLSLYPTYMSVRGKIRQAVWGGVSYSERLERMALLVSEYRGLDLENRQDLEAINGRLNQNYLIGRAVNRLEAGQADYAQGDTLWNALVALIPRALWPGKPTYAGSGGLVTRFTGIQFAKGTSVGIGHVMELYVNFGTPGVLLGYVLLGALLGLLDSRSATCLLRGDWKGFTALYLIGVSFLQAGGNFAEATGTAAGSVVLCFLVFSCVRGRPAPPATALPVPSGKEIRP
jgi:hypothetical protein